ncbi:ankyrin repeat domain-containing protein 53 [Equus przewalskii]|uniref:Ankyrin repeat domain-containing protein 53 n=1 Tax=Equus przewalskii TaxID=9798 RepID=A0ABM2FGS3_EQUPR
MQPAEKVSKVSRSDSESRQPRWAGIRWPGCGAGETRSAPPGSAGPGAARGAQGSRLGPGSPPERCPGPSTMVASSSPRQPGGLASVSTNAPGRECRPRPHGAPSQAAQPGPASSSSSSPHPSPLPSPLPHSDSSPVDERDQRAIGRDSELFAAALGNLEWLRFCLNRDRGEILANDKGFTAIHFAAQSCKLACLQVLVEEYKFPVNLPTNNGQTPLHLVIHRDNKTMALPCIHYLLKQGAALNTRTCNGSTPLHLAAREGLLNCVEVLVQNGANVHAQDAMGCKPIDYCKVWNHRICARFLKDAMWKWDKKNFAREMGKLKRLKDQLALMEQDYLTDYQKEHKSLREADFKKWLHGKRLPGGQSLMGNSEQEPCAPPQAVAVSKTPRHRGLWPPKSFHPSPEARLQQTLQLKPPPLVMPKPIYMRPMVRRPKLWNLSNNPARSPTIQIGYPQGIRLGVHPDPWPEHDFSSFLRVRSNGHGGVSLCTVTGKLVSPVPRLPFEVIVRGLYPSVQPYRMKVPQDLYSVSMRDVPRKRHLGDDTFWTDSLAMNLRETFDEAFLAAVRAHQGLLTLSSPKTHP